jgi:carbon monoxide dehydrogenase subunit G
MELEHSFTVPVPKERAWDVLLDVEKVAPCMPGTTLDSVDGDVINGRIKVKVGPISMTYTGRAEIVEKDEAAGVIRMDASGKETKGAGTASASVRSLLEGVGNETRVTVHTTMNVTGKPAQFGRGVMNEVGGRLVSIFAENLAAMLSEPEAPSGDGAPSSGGDSAASPGAAGEAEASGTSGEGAAGASIEDLHLNSRAVAVLHREGLSTITDLTAKTADEILAIDGIGPASLDEIRNKLTERGLTLANVAAPPQASPAVTGPPAPPAAPSAGAGATTASSNGQSPNSGATASPDSAASRRRPVRRKDDSINLLKVAGGPVLKRSIPLLAGVTAVIIIGWRRRIRRHR